jgi:hypothetical protein
MGTIISYGISSYDELMDDVDYYPDQYLNRVAHEGINGLWRSVQFKDLCKTSIVPEYGNNVECRLAKLRHTVEKCRRYGIRVYLFAVEPAAWTVRLPAFEKYPELLAANGCFCPGSEAAQKYLYEATNGIFAAVPHLGGMINISYGESATTCLSAIAPHDNARLACPVCAKQAPGAILRQALASMARGIVADHASPQQEAVSPRSWHHPATPRGA